MEGLRNNLFSLTSVACVLGLLPLWIDFWWRQRGLSLILPGALVIVVLALVSGAAGWRRGEAAGRLATLAAVVWPLTVFVWMNFAGNP